MTVWTKRFVKGPIQATENGWRHENQTIDAVVVWWNTCKKFWADIGGIVSFPCLERQSINQNRKRIDFFFILFYPQNKKDGVDELHVFTQIESVHPEIKSFHQHMFGIAKGQCKIKIVFLLLFIFFFSFWFFFSFLFFFDYF